MSEKVIDIKEVFDSPLKVRRFNLIFQGQFIGAAEIIDGAEDKLYQLLALANVAAETINLNTKVEAIAPTV